jgi:hypothetical protein
MFEKEIKFIVDYTLNKLRREVAHINMGRFLNSSIHPAIIKYCSAEIDSQIRNDRNKLLTDSFFDYSGKEISKYFNLITEEIRQNYKMKGEDLKKLIIKAVSFNVNYVIRPGWTLSKFIFSQEKEKSIRDLLYYFNYVYYYDYQIKVLSAFIQKRKIDLITRDEFVLLVGKIDKEVISSNRKEIIREGVVSLADFLNEGAMNKDKLAPYLLEAYFKDKKFIEAAELLRKIYANDDKLKQPVKDIVKRLSAGLKEEIVIPEKPDVHQDENVAEKHEMTEIVSEQETVSESAVYTDTPVPENEPEEEQQSSVEKESAVIETVDAGTVTEQETAAEETASESEKEEKEEFIITAAGEDYHSTLSDLMETGQEAENIPEQITPENKIQEEFSNEGDIQEEVPDETEPVAEAESSETFNETNVTEDSGKKEFAFKYYIPEVKETEKPEIEDKKAEKPENGKAVKTVEVKEVNKKTDILQFLSKREIDKIVSSLFNDDPEEFALTLDKITECGSYEDASSILKNVFKTYRINPYSKDAIFLTSAVVNFFSKE